MPVFWVLAAIAPEEGAREALCKSSADRAEIPAVLMFQQAGKQVDLGGQGAGNWPRPTPVRGVDITEQGYVGWVAGGCLHPCMCPCCAPAEHATVHSNPVQQSHRMRPG